MKMMFRGRGLGRMYLGTKEITNVKFRDTDNSLGNYIINGTFDTVLTPWVLKFDAVLSVNAGRLRVTSNGSPLAGRAHQQIDGLLVGADYELIADMYAIDTSAASMFMTASANGSTAGIVGPQVNVPSPGTVLQNVARFTATQTTMYAELMSTSTTLDSFVEFDNVKLRRAIT